MSHIASWVGSDIEVKQVEQNIFKGAEGFYFEDEAQSDLFGPMPTIEEARKELDKYCRWLSSGDFYD